MEPAAHPIDVMDGRGLLAAQHNPGPSINDGEGLEANLKLFEAERASVRPIGTFSGTAIVVLQNIVGVGTLSFAKAFADASLVPGIFVMLASYGLGILSSVTIVACLESSRQQTFLGIVEHLFNRRAAVVVELAVGLTTFCSTLAYMIDIVDALSHFIGAFNSNAFLKSRLFAALCVCVPCVVLTSFRDLNRLKPFSACGVLGLHTSYSFILFMHRCCSPRCSRCLSPQPRRRG